MEHDGFATSIPVAVGVTGNEVMLKNTTYYLAGDNVQVRVRAGRGDAHGQLGRRDHQ